MQSQSVPDIKKLPSVFVIFGATGDLARKKIFPSFFELFKNGLLPEKFKIIAAARSPFTTDQFLQIVKETVDAKGKDWDKFANLIEYFQCDVEQDINLDKLEDKLEGIEKDFRDCAQRIFYMAISPYIYESAFDMLGKHSLHLGCKGHGTKTRIVIEKPFGYNYESSQVLNQKLSTLYAETQIFRIDHVLGKETVQNIFAFRFANEIFEPIWNNKYIDNIQITYAEYVGVDRRGEYYDRAGALRDIIQNHLLQLLCIATMEEPTKFDQPTIREKKLEILKSIKKITPQEVENSSVRGQYEGYQSEEKVDPKSTTETYAMVKLAIENERWRGVPIYLRTGKKLTGKVTSIIFAFKENIHELYKGIQKQPLPNSVTIQIQPNEGIGIRLVVKKPGLSTELEPVDMEFCYRRSFDSPQPDAYERLLMDVISGDQTLFLGQVGESWKIIDPIREVWDNNKPNLVTYKPGTWGPQEAEDLIKEDGRQWLAPLLTICKI